MEYTFRPRGICAVQIDFAIEDGLIRNVRYTRGCDGNHKGIASLVEGMRAEEVVERLSGITCGYRDTSCPDQLARAIAKALEKEKERVD